MADEGGILAFWKYMISLRKSEPALREGDYFPAYMKGSIYAFERVLDGKRLLSICNFSAKTVKLPRQLAQWDQVVASNYDDIAPVLRPFEFRLMQEEVAACD